MKQKRTQNKLVIHSLAAALILGFTALTPTLVCAEKADLTKELIALGKIATRENGDKTGDGETNIIEGNVDIEQGTLKILAHKLVLKTFANNYRFGEALGKLNAPVKFRQKREGKDSYVDGTAERIVYDEQKETIEMFGNVRVKLGEDEFNGQYVTYNMTSDKFVLDGATAPNTAKSTTADDGRIRVVLKPRIQPAAGSVITQPDAATAPKK